MTVLVITGTGTGVGKTIATAALASHARGIGGDVAVCKPVQTGTGTPEAPGDDDLAEVKRLSGLGELLGVARYREPLAPAAAADRDGRALPSAEELLGAVRSIERPGRLTLVEGAGGLLVELTAQRETLRDLAADLDAQVLVVCAAGLGTLNHTALTLEALEVKGVSCAGLVVGSWPPHPGLAERSNLAALGRLAAVRAVLPQDAGGLGGDEFAAMSRRAFDSDWVAALF